MASPRSARQRARRLQLRAARVRGNPWLTVPALYRCSTAAAPARRKVARMPHLPFLAIAATRRRRADLAAGWTELSREHRVRVHGIASGLRRPARCLPGSDRGRRSGGRPEQGLPAHPVRARGRLPSSGYTGRDPASARGGLGRRSCGVDARSRRLERWRRRRRGARPRRESRLRRRRSNRRASRRRRPRAPDHRRRRRIGRRRRRDRRPDRDRRRQRRRADRGAGLRRPRVGEPGDRRQGRHPDRGRRPGPERVRSLGHRDGGLPRARRQRRRRRQPAAAVAEEAGSTAAAEAAPAAPSAAATAAAARASAPRGRCSEPVSAPASGARRSATTATLAVRRALATRKPMCAWRRPGRLWLRIVQRAQARPGLANEPPRSTRSPGGYSVDVHSQTFPAMSSRP